ncbi:hypothetical protein M9H77_35640 [Catharanthus roseus]|uniref:Uncharacterized protein n=1 Tax=Catharanthus roseus TaxID=4058 RepID=A0ACB9ZQC4_CATRO|nr:hypothetical protein M9H77_35640 [Catharanthus roseus]
MQRKKAKNDSWEQTSPANGGPQDPVLVPSYNGHIACSIWRGHDRGILKARTITFDVLHVPASELLLAICLCGEVAARHYQFPHALGEMIVTLHNVEFILGVSSYGNISELDISDSSIGINGQDFASIAESPGSGLSKEQRAACYVLGHNVPGKLWPLVKNAWIYLYFSMFAPPVRPEEKLCKSYIQRFAMLGYKT